MQVITENKVVPKLRFEEFEMEWVKVLLKNCTLKIGSGLTPKGGNKVYQKVGIPFIRSQNVIDNKLVLSDNIFISDEINSKMKGSIVKPNDILLNITGGSIGRSCVVPLEFVKGNVNQHVCIIRLDNEHTPYFIQPFLASQRGQKLIQQGQTGSGREGLNFQSIASFKLHLPSLPEQQKIASFLSAVDKKLQQLTKKKELLEEYKKGVMQKIFFQELRFKDDNGNNYPDWEEKRIEDLFIVTRGTVLAIPKISPHKNDECPYPVFSSQTKNNGIAGYYKDYLFEDAITWTTDGAQAGEVNLRKGKFYCTNVCGVLKSDEGYANLCIAEKLNRVSRRYVSYVGNPKLMNNVMAKIKISIPSSLDEHQKIADFLSSLDSKIELVSTQIDNNNVFKKGLLQQMFV